MVSFETTHTMDFSEILLESSLGSRVKKRNASLDSLIGLKETMYDLDYGLTQSMNVSVHIKLEASRTNASDRSSADAGNDCTHDRIEFEISCTNS